ncbi:hypothetical protein LIER_42742 [Lithospermum erythrorhizon]|uniref:RING-type domain-containing protein n=1 Tax=Lithospermum erythrorhizon TaxID=34254 RepID=A0AAV3NU52_LITER
MSTTNPFFDPPPPLITTTLSPTSRNISNLGLGYAIVIALAFLVLLSILFLSFYICCRRNHHPHQPNNDENDNAIYLPRILFVAEDDEENQNENSTPIGLNQSIINSYPRFIYSKKLGNSNTTNVNVIDQTNETTCPICLCEYKESEMLRMLPDCKHCFHVTCIDAWLKLNGSCPVCRNSPLPTPLSTPLAEVVPLSQYSDGRRRRV